LILLHEVVAVAVVLRRVAAELQLLAAEREQTQALTEPLTPVGEVEEKALPEMEAQAVQAWSSLRFLTLTRLRSHLE
jgi:hypothetical protein